MGDHGLADVLAAEDCAEEVGGEELVDFKLAGVKEEFGLGDAG